jgi:hypothetical protein
VFIKISTVAFFRSISIESCITCRMTVFRSFSFYYSRNIFTIVAQHTFRSNKSQGRIHLPIDRQISYFYTRKTEIHTRFRPAHFAWNLLVNVTPHLTWYSKQVAWQIARIKCEMKPYTKTIIFTGIRKARTIVRSGFFIPLFSKQIEVIVSGQISLHLFK